MPGTNVYPNNADCKWLVTVRTRQAISVRIHMLSIEVSAGCSYDSLTFFNGALNNIENLLARMCTNNITNDQFRTSGHQLLVEFKSDASVQLNGFYIYYEAVEAHDCRLHHKF